MKFILLFIFFNLYSPARCTRRFLTNQTQMSQTTRCYATRSSTILQFSRVADATIEEYIASLPDDVTQLQIQYENIPVFPSLARFPFLQSFLLISCQTETLPSDLGQNTELQTLNVSRNRLTTMPDLRTLFRLTKVSMHNNAIRDVSFLPNNLCHLDAAYNLIDDLQPLANFVNLRHVNVHHNRIVRAPPFTIRFMNLSENPLHVFSGLGGHVFSGSSKGFDLWITNTPIHAIMKEINWRILGQPDQNFSARLHSSIMAGRLILYQRWNEKEYASSLFACWMEFVDRLYRFRWMFHVGKCRRRLRQFAFGVIQRFAERKYHPSELQKLMDGCAWEKDPHASLMEAVERW